MALGQILDDTKYGMAVPSPPVQSGPLVPSLLAVALAEEADPKSAKVNAQDLVKAANALAAVSPASGLFVPLAGAFLHDAMDISSAAESSSELDTEEEAIVARACKRAEEDTLAGPNASASGSASAAGASSGRVTGEAPMTPEEMEEDPKRNDEVTSEAGESVGAPM